MPNLDLLTEIHTDVKYIKDSLNKHIEKDEKIQQEYLKPLWEAHQQAQGAARFATIVYGVIGSGITLAAGFLTGLLHK